MPDSKTYHNLESLAAQCQDLLPGIVWHVCQRFHRYPTAEKIEDYVGAMLLHLLANDAHYLKAYDTGKGKLKTWLNVVTEHKLVYEFKHEKAWDSLDETIAEQLWVRWSRFDGHKILLNNRQTDYEQDHPTRHYHQQKAQQV